MAKLQDMRLRKGLSQSQLSRAAAVNLRTLQNYEGGRNDFNKAHIKVLLRCAMVLECGIEDIIDDQEAIDLLSEYYKRVKKWKKSEESGETHPRTS